MILLNTYIIFQIDGVVVVVQPEVRDRRAEPKENQKHQKRAKRQHSAETIVLIGQKHETNMQANRVFGSWPRPLESSGDEWN